MTRHHSFRHREAKFTRDAFINLRRKWTGGYFQIPPWFPCAAFFNLKIMDMQWTSISFDSVWFNFPSDHLYCSSIRGGGGSESHSCYLTCRQWRHSFEWYFSITIVSGTSLLLEEIRSLFGMQEVVICDMLHPQSLKLTLSTNKLTEIHPIGGK